MQEKEYRIKLTEEDKNKLEQVLKLVDIIVDMVEVEDTKEQKGFPQDGDDYYFLVSEGLIDDSFFIVGDSVSEHRLSIGNCFKTREEAEFEVERLKVIAEMKKFAESEDREWDGENEHWMLYIDTHGDVNYGYNNLYRYAHIYFETQEKAKECVESIGEDRIRKFYLQIKE